MLGCMREAHQSERELYASEPQRALQNPTLQDLDPTLTLTLRCMGGVAQWPTKHGVLHGSWLDPGAKVRVRVRGRGRARVRV